MKFAAIGKLPWDMVVFLTITTAGLGVSFKRLAYPERVGAFAEAEEGQVPKGIIDLGCIDRKGSLERLTYNGLTFRLKGQLCDISRKQGLGMGAIRVKNVTSNEEGTVFLQGSHAKFISNEMTLRRGKNTLQIAWNDPTSGSEKTLTAELFEP